MKSKKNNFSLLFPFLLCSCFGGFLVGGCLISSCFGGVGWWLLAPNTPRQDRRPCTHRRNLKFRLPVFFRLLPGKGQTEWFALCTPCSFFPDATVFPPKRMRGSRGKTFGWPPGRQVSKHSQEQKFNFCDGCRAFGPAEGCWGRVATNPPRIGNRDER